MTRQPLWVVLCHLPEKGRKEIEEIKEGMKERKRGTGKKENKNESEETEEIKTSPPLPLPATRIAGLAQL